jgi:hypothetical protein
VGSASREEAEEAMRDPITHGQLLRGRGEAEATGERVREWLGEGFRFTTFEEFARNNQADIIETYKNVPDA